MANEQTRSARRQKSGTPNKSGTPPRKPGKKRKWSSILLKIFIGLITFGCIAFLAGVGLFWFYAKDAPEITDKALESTNSSKLFAADGSEFEELGSEKRESISPNDVPQKLEDAIVSVEDRRFYKHHGVDPIRIVGSALSNVTSGSLQGGSTLTQQLIKLSYFSTKASDQTLKRKAQEAWLAVNLEKKKSKQEILTYYINKVYMSNGLSGMETASETYFGKQLKELSLGQTALLAGMPQAPSSYDPYVHKDQAKKRRDTVLYTMLENDKISEAEYNQAKAEPIDDGLQPLPDTKQNTKLVDNYVREVINEVQEKTGKNVYTDGLEIHTNLDMDAQKHLYDIVNGDEYVAYPDQEMQVASTLIDVKTGEVKAQIGGRHISDDVTLGQNLAVNTLRDFGSTMKPLTDYGPAFEYLNLSSGQLIDDSPYNYEGTNPPIPVKNWDNDYMREITVRKALYASRNVPAVKLFNEVGADKSAAFLKKLGIEYKQIHQSNAISSNTEEQDGEKYGASSLKMAAAYAAFANGGTYYKPQYVNKVVYRDGTEKSYEPEGTKAMSPETAYMITDILKNVVNPAYRDASGTGAYIPGLVQAGKTGTSNYTDDEYAKIGVSQGVYPDILFSGYSPTYSISVWTGYKNKLTPVTDDSKHVAADVYRELMQYMAGKTSNDDWVMPDGLVRTANNELYYRDHQYTGKLKSSASTSPAPAVTQPVVPVTPPETPATPETPAASETPASSSSSEEKQPETPAPSSSSEEKQPEMPPASSSSSEEKQPETPPASSSSSAAPQPTPPASSSSAAPQPTPPASSSSAAPQPTPPASSSSRR